LWALAYYPRLPAGREQATLLGGGPSAVAAAQSEYSLAGRVGHAMEPALRPLGFDWKMGVGLVGAFAAREVFVSTMGVVFNAEAEGENTAPLTHAVNAARWPDGRVLFTPLVCFTLMIFYVFAMQCMSTIAVVRRETNSWRWPIFQTAYMTGAAWIISFIVYQSGTALGF